MSREYGHHVLTVASSATFSSARGCLVSAACLDVHAVVPVVQATTDHVVSMAEIGLAAASDFEAVSSQT